MIAVEKTRKICVFLVTANVNVPLAMLFKGLEDLIFWLVLLAIITWPYGVPTVNFLLQLRYSSVVLACCRRENERIYFVGYVVTGSANPSWSLTAAVAHAKVNGRVHAMARSCSTGLMRTHAASVLQLPVTGSIVNVLQRARTNVTPEISSWYFWGNSMRQHKMNVTLIR